MATAGHAEMPSQVLPEPPYLYGPMAEAAVRLSPPLIKLRMFPAEPTHDAQGNPHIAPPCCGWSLGEGEVTASGPLSTMSFIAIWNEGVTTAAGVPITMEIESPEWLTDVPFVHVHPSGYLMAIWYDSAAGKFMRSVLYPT